MAIIGVVVFGFAPTGCGAGADSDVVRPTGEESSSAGSDPARVAIPGGRVVFVGTSLTAGLGLANPSTRFTDQIQALADSAGLPFRMINAGVSGETSAGGLRRMSWLLRAPVDVLVLELGANDGLRAIAPDSMKANLQAVIDSTRTHYPKARLLLAGMQAPPNPGQPYARAFSTVFSELARTNDGTLIPFLLEGVAGMPELNQADGIHPTPRGHRIIAQTIWQHLHPILDDLQTERPIAP